MRASGTWRESPGGIEETLTDLRLVNAACNLSHNSISSYTGSGACCKPASGSPPPPARWPRDLKLISRDFFCRGSAARTAFWHDTTGEIGASKSHRYILSRWQVERAIPLRSAAVYSIKSRKDCSYRSVAKSLNRGSWMKQMYRIILHWKNYYFNKNLIYSWRRKVHTGACVSLCNIF